jgi:hypothetical protein
MSRDRSSPAGLRRGVEDERPPASEHGGGRVPAGASESGRRGGGSPAGASESGRRGGGSPIGARRRRSWPEKGWWQAGVGAGARPGRQPREEHGRAAASRAGEEHVWAGEEPGRGGARANGGKIWLGYSGRSTGGPYPGRGARTKKCYPGIPYLHVCGGVKC